MKGSLSFGFKPSEGKPEIFFSKIMCKAELFGITVAMHMVYANEHNFFKVHVGESGDNVWDTGHSGTLLFEAICNVMNILQHHQREPWYTLEHPY